MIEVLKRRAGKGGREFPAEPVTADAGKFFEVGKRIFLFIMIVEGFFHIYKIVGNRLLRVRLFQGRKNHFGENVMKLLITKQNIF